MSRSNMVTSEAVVQLIRFPSGYHSTLKQEIACPDHRINRKGTKRKKFESPVSFLSSFVAL